MEEEALRQAFAERETGPAPVILPDEDVFVQSVQALYQEIDHLRNKVRWQEEQLKGMAVELLLLGRWKPADYINELLGFPHHCYMIANYDFFAMDPVGTEENPEMALLKREIYEIFSAVFLPEYPSCCCETDFGLNTVLINLPDACRKMSSAEESTFLNRAGLFVGRVETALGVRLRLALSFCVSEIRELPGALSEVGRLRQLQEAFPEAAQILYAGRLELVGGQAEEISREEMEQALQAGLRERDVPAVHRCVTRLAMNRLQQTRNMDRVVQWLTRELDSLNRQLDLPDHRIDFLLEAQTALQQVHKVDEMLIVVNRYFSSVDLFLQEQEDSRGRVQTLASSARACMDSHYMEPSLDVAAVAQMLGASENRVSKTFRRAYGIGALAYIQNLRVQRAIALLSEGGQPVSRVWQQAGFSSRRTFDRVFKQFTGMTAVQYMRTSGTQGPAGSA